MITVKNLIEKLQFLIENNYLNKDDFVYILGTGDKKSRPLNNVVFPKVSFNEATQSEILNDDYGFYSIGFTEQLIIKNIDLSFNKTIGENVDIEKIK